MARGRMINQSIATDKRLNSLSLEAHLVYMMTIPHLDRDGLVLGEPFVLASQVCPRRPELVALMEGIVGEWIAAELVIQYDGKEDPILFFAGFTKNQSGLRYDRETPSQFPPPPGYKRTNSGLLPDDEHPEPTPSRHESGNPPESVRHGSGTSPAEGNRKEEKRIAGGVPSEAVVNGTHTRNCRPHQSPEPVPRDLLTDLTNHVKRIYGYEVLIRKKGNPTIEKKMHDEAVRLYELGFTNDTAMLALAEAWHTHAANFSDKRPYKDQLYEVALRHASATNGTPSHPARLVLVPTGDHDE